MCGIVGLLVRDPSMEADLGRNFAAMLDCMTSRGPDSAGMAMYSRDVTPSAMRWSLRNPAPDFDWLQLAKQIQSASGAPADIDVRGNIAFLESTAASALVEEACALDNTAVVGFGESMRLVKDIGTSHEICERYELDTACGYMAVGHTRMATESAVTTEHSHPFSPTPDLAVVHNGSFSNHATIRRRLSDMGIACVTDNDTEVAAQFIGWRLSEGDTLEEAMRHVLREFDGFFTLLVASRNQFCVVRDAFACKPLVVAETDRYVAVASEYQALADLPGIENARIFEPQPEEIHSWTVA